MKSRDDKQIFPVNIKASFFQFSDVLHLFPFSIVKIIAGLRVAGWKRGERKSFVRVKGFSSLQNLLQLSLKAHLSLQAASFQKLRSILSQIDFLKVRKRLANI